MLIKKEIINNYFVMVSKKSNNYEVPFKFRKHFSPEECESMVNAFKHYDKDNSGTIDKGEFKSIVKDMGHD